MQLQLFEFLSLLTRLAFLKANPRYGKMSPKGSAAPEIVPVPSCLRKVRARVRVGVRVRQPIAPPYCPARLPHPIAPIAPRAVPNAPPYRPTLLPRVPDAR